MEFKDQSFDVDYNINDEDVKKYNMVEELTKYVWIWMNEYNEEFRFSDLDLYSRDAKTKVYYL